VFPFLSRGIATDDFKRIDSFLLGSVHSHAHEKVGMTVISTSFKNTWYEMVKILEVTTKYRVG
jgi:hypothetical protein